MTTLEKEKNNSPHEFLQTYLCYHYGMLKEDDVLQNRHSVLC